MLGALASTTSPVAPSSAPASVHGWRRPNREVVRSDSRPITGFASSAAMAPAPVTRPNTSSLLAWSNSSACCGSSTWIGAYTPSHRPRLAKKSHAIQLRRTGTSGSPSASVLVGDDIAVPAVGVARGPFLRLVVHVHQAEALGVARVPLE